MSLKNGRNNRWDMNSSESEVLFAESERRLLAKKQIIADMQNEYNLLEEQAYQLYKDHVSYWRFGESFIVDVRKWLKMVSENKDADGNKLDRRKKYHEKAIYDYVNQYLSDQMGYEIIIKGVIQYGWVAEGYNLEFDLNGKRWALFVPVPEKVSMKTFQLDGGNSFKLKIYEYTTENCRSLCGQTYWEEDLKDIMTKALGGEQ